MIKIKAIPAFTDNYIWCAYSTATNNALIIDPGSSDGVKQFLRENNLKLQSIFVTHHHPDHTAGIKDLKKETDATIYGSERSKLDFIDVRVKSGDKIKFDSYTFAVLEVPGHTLDHIAFYSELSDENSPPALFIGDTLFSAGCGRLFEGTAEQMFNSLNQISKLPNETLIYPAHEYTLANLEFALYISPNNTDILAYKTKCEQLREKNLATLPSSLKLEKLINPFLKSKDLEFQRELRTIYPDTGPLPLDVFTQIRKAKDTF